MQTAEILHKAEEDSRQKEIERKAESYTAYVPKFIEAGDHNVAINLARKTATLTRRIGRCPSQGKAGSPDICKSCFQMVVNKEAPLLSDDKIKYLVEVSLTLSESAIEYVVSVTFYDFRTGRLIANGVYIKKPLRMCPHCAS